MDSRAIWELFPSCTRIYDSLLIIYFIVYSHSLLGGGGGGGGGEGWLFYTLYARPLLREEQKYYVTCYLGNITVEERVE